MNILLLTTIYPSPTEMGISPDTKAIHYFAKEWKKAGHNVKVIYLHQIPIKSIFKNGIKNISKIIKPKIKDYKYENIDVKLVEYQLLVPHADTLLKFQAKGLQSILNSIENEIDFTIDAVSVHFPLSFLGLNIFSNTDCKKIAVLHNCDVKIIKNSDNNTVNKYLSQYDTIGCRNSKISKFVKDSLNLDSSIIHSGIDSKLIASEKLINEKSAAKRDYLNIMFAGNLIPLKNVDVIIKALKNVDFDYKLSIVGSGPEEKKLKTIVFELEMTEKVEFLGRLSREDTTAMMQKSDLFVMPSSPETFGLVYLEALAQGCITVGSKGEGIDGVIIDSKNGFLVSPKNPEELTILLNRIFSLNSEDKKAIILNGYSLALNMTDEKMAKNYISIINSI